MSFDRFARRNWSLSFGTDMECIGLILLYDFILWENEYVCKTRKTLGYPSNWLSLTVRSDIFTALAIPFNALTLAAF